MKIVLGSTYETCPIGLRTIASHLENEGHDVFLRWLYRAKKTKIIRMLNTIKPDVIGLTCYTPGILKVLEVAQLIKQNLPTIKIVLGNIHAALFYDTILEKFSCIDYIVFGEGEVPMKELTEYIIGKRNLDEVHNIAYRANNGNIIRTKKQTIFPSLDDLSCIPKRPMPREIIVSQLPREKRSHAVTLLYTSRGCLYRCAYCCGNNVLEGNGPSAQSPIKAVNSVEDIYNRYRIKTFLFCDPIFTFNKERTIEICREIQRRGLNMRFLFQTHPNHIDEELIRAVKDAGAFYINIGVDCTTNEAMKHYRNTVVNYDRLQKVIRLATSLNIFVCLNLIVGWPGESFSSIFVSIANLWKLRPSATRVVPLYLIPGTKLFNDFVYNKRVDNLYWLKPITRSFYFYYGLIGNDTKNIKGRFTLGLQRLLLQSASLVCCRYMSGIFNRILSYVSVLKWNLFSRSANTHTGSKI